MGLTEWDSLLRIAVAIVLGGLIGYERETLDKSAGLRTHMLVSLGAALFMVASILIVQDFATGDGTSRLDPTRIGSTIVTGVGFLGGGIIFRQEDRVHGLTTAAGLWVAAAIGLACGAGYFVLAIGGSILTVTILAMIRPLEKRFENRRDSTD
ncbi:MAG: MgtC/SapB family protein [Thermomicrobiales bacterium]|jgi:putative Mg2+ transporter-C (MgtC) family protein|nr:MgtC/SapB family protein [Thermomicrobiales bacterium]